MNVNTIKHNVLAFEFWILIEVSLDDYLA